MTFGSWSTILIRGFDDSASASAQLTRRGLGAGGLGERQAAGPAADLLAGTPTRPTDEGWRVKLWGKL